MYRSPLYFKAENSKCCIMLPPPPPPAGVMGCGAAEATGLGFVCFVVLNPRVLSANRVDFGLCLFHIFSHFTPPPPSIAPNRDAVLHFGRPEKYYCIAAGVPEIRRRGDGCTTRASLWSDNRLNFSINPR